MAITAKNKANEREVQMMVGKAMCAYANWQSAKEHLFSTVDGIENTEEQNLFIAAYKSEYEATCRCIAMFTVEHLPEVCQTVIDRAKSEFEI